MNLSLKIAILRDGRPQWAIAQQAGIGPVRLSTLVRGHAQPKADEAERLSLVLGEPACALFHAPVATPESTREAVPA